MARIVRSLLSQVRPVIGALFLLPIFSSASFSTEKLAVTETIPVVG